MTLPYREQFKKMVIPEMKKEFGFKNDFTVPKITKVVINVGVGRLVAASKDSQELIGKISGVIAIITGQKPSLRPAKKSIASFKVREGMPVGLKVTLRGKRMEDFIYRFINLGLPRIRDFWGIPLKNIDEKGNLNYGIKEYNIFPEAEQIQNIPTFGLEITFVTNAKNREQAIRLYQLLGFPLWQKNQ
ncbi:MAG: 50S ribosomal protein L5 [Candidatus Pacebacteria bacterium]|nr:50S ribosomal protein L5 [Candidatus Paceibacterota bacterium]